MKTLFHLPIGKKGIIKKITADHATKERLESLGLVRGVEISPVRTCPLGCPKIYKCLNTLIGIRNEIAKKVEVEVTDDEEKNN